jgi:uncharacterized SAM-binding protein YcdF (DUF218 family)
MITINIYLRYFKLFFLLGFLPFITSCNRALFNSTEKTYSQNIKNAPFDAIIVPGFPYDGDHWDNVIKIRVLWSKYLYDEGYTKNIIFSGSSVYSPYIESKVFAAYAEALGIPSINIFTEERAEHSTENVYYSYLIAKHQGFKKIALATDPFQTNSLRPFIRKFDLPVISLPVIYDSISTLNDPEPEVNLKDAKVANFMPLQERHGMFNRIAGTLGKHIVWHEDDLKKKKFQRRFKNRMIAANRF